MTIFRFSLAFAVAAVASVPAVCRTDVDVTPASAEERCENVDPQLWRDCSARQIAGKELKLKRLYGEALDAVAKGFRKYGGSDNRTNPAYLQRSQAEWRRFIDNDCTVKAAFGGGSNSSISDRYSDCYETELDRRIEFLEQLANGSYGIG